MLGSGAFLLQHETGHALVHLLDLPFTGREEVAVDDLAAVSSLRGKPTARSSKKG